MYSKQFSIGKEQDDMLAGVAVVIVVVVAVVLRMFTYRTFFKLIEFSHGLNESWIFFAPSLILQ